MSPGFVADSARYFELLDSGHQVVDETEVFYQLMRARLDRPCRIVGVTGTNAKTTTTSLLGHLLREAGISTVMGDNIGVPLCSVLDEMPPLPAQPGQRAAQDRRQSRPRRHRGPA